MDPEEEESNSCPPKSKASPTSGRRATYTEGTSSFSNSSGTASEEATIMEPLFCSFIATENGLASIMPSGKAKDVHNRTQISGNEIDVYL